MNSTAMQYFMRNGLGGALVVAVGCFSPDGSMSPVTDTEGSEGSNSEGVPQVNAPQEPLEDFF